MPKATFGLCLNEPTSRRMAFAFPAFAGGAVCLVSTAKASDTGEAIRRSASKIPGYGPSDIFYPDILKGKWKATREIVGDKTIEYEVRFIQSVEFNATVADRGFNQASLERALAPDISIRSYEWTETNPNDLRLVYGDGTSKELKVTKRAAERTDDTASSSEFRRVTTENSRGIPMISAERTLSKWKIGSDGIVQGLEITYDMGGGGDPLIPNPMGGSSTEPTVLSKSRIRLEKFQ
eukprot:CAMPEP_0194221002 /NCGR_PEP_ID=MMETSP0156-20130528/29679_1 /TAXON_ID=33649 /ORGANISM="Thalassionema nitzschioides, Strain L26-B" /LENGTH=235 /DNA_ID=CAMNT_0038951271 /DNA_START=89 /DNA_END=799 /DNA_ORIENTATION=+